MEGQEPGDPAAAVGPLLRARQTREFTDEPVGPAALDAMADAARWSGSAANSQPWRFVILTDRPTIRRIADAGMPSAAALQTATAAIAIVMPAEPASKIAAAYDEGRAAERILVAATLIGLGAGINWLVGDARAVAAEALGLPPDRMVRTVVAIGHPTETARRPRPEGASARLPREETVFRGRWPDGETAGRLRRGSAARRAAPRGARTSPRGPR